MSFIYLPLLSKSTKHHMNILPVTETVKIQLHQYKILQWHVPSSHLFLSIHTICIRVYNISIQWWDSSKMRKCVKNIPKRWTKLLLKSAGSNATWLYQGIFCLSMIGVLLWYVIFSLYDLLQEAQLWNVMQLPISE